MRRWIEAVAKLYPAKWQQRYGAEFQALLSDIEPSWRQLFNVLGGALKMQFSMGNELYLKLAAVFAVLGMMIAAAASFAVPRQYVSSATFRVAPASNSQSKAISDQPLLSAMQVAYSRTSLAEIIRRPELDLYPKERFRKPLEDVVGQMGHDLRITRVQSKNDGFTARIDFLYKDPQKARQVVSAILSRFVDELASQRMPADWGAQNITVLDPASVPAEPVLPNRPVFVAVGFAVGVLCGLIATYYVKKPRRAMLLTATALAGSILGAGFSLLIANRYVSTAVVRIVPVGGQASADAAGELQRAAARIYGRTNLADLIQRPELNLYAKERATTPLESVIKKIQEHDLKVELIGPGGRIGVPLSKTMAVEVRFEYPDRYKAQAMVRSVTRELAQSGTTGSIEYLDGASLPESPVFPNRYVISAMGSALGVLIGAISIWAMRRRTPAVAA